MAMIDFGQQAMTDNKDVNTNTSGASTKRKNITKEGFDKIVYDILAADNGLASIVSGENAAGGHGGSTKALLTQDFVTKIAGELANLTAEDVSTNVERKEADSQTPLNEFFGEPQSIGDASVICSELVRLGCVPRKLYHHPRAIRHFSSLNKKTLIGYWSWGNKIVPKLASSKALRAFWTPIVISRYEMIVNKKFGFLGALTIYAVQPICYIIGTVIEILETLNHGGSKHA